MSLETDTILYRRRIKRQVTLWRIVAVVGFVALGLALFGGNGALPQRDHVAVLSVSGVIIEDRARVTALTKAAKDDGVVALIVHIDSPGGTVVGGETLFKALRAFAKEKPVIAVMGEVAASAGYMVALGADRILAHEGTITGSIGVIMQTTEISGLLEKLGIKPEAIRSRPLKAVPNPLEPMTSEGREAARIVVLDMFDMFVDMVAERRNLSRTQALELADGRIYTGRQARKNALIDDIGGVEVARDWLDTDHDISTSLPTKNIKIKRANELWDQVFDSLSGKAFISERLRLDGLVSLWHPEVH